MPGPRSETDDALAVLGTVVWDASALFARWTLYFGMLIDGSHTARCRISSRIGEEVVLALFRKQRWDALEHFAAGAKQGWFNSLPVLVTDDEVATAARQFPAVDAGDHHVVAAAMKEAASFIVTNNLGHFAVEDLDAAGIRVLSADDFGVVALERNGAAIVQLARHDGQVVDVLADRLTAAGLPTTAGTVRSLLAP